MTTPVERGEPSRKELERAAFARADTPAEIAAAQDALRRLVEDDAALAALARPASAPEPLPPPTPVETRDEAEIPPRGRRTLVPIIILIGLFAGAAIGILVAREQPTPSIGGGVAVSVTPGPTPDDAAAALKSMLAPQTTADKGFPLPVYSGTATIQPASVHRIMTAADGAVLWTGRSDTEICLMWTHRSSPDGIDGGMACAAPSEFDTSGVSISEGDTSWTWNGIAFTTTIGG